MREVCYCGRVGAVEDREPAPGEGWALRCVNCGRVEYLDRLFG
jgi:hypothetical protein